MRIGFRIVCLLLVLGISSIAAGTARAEAPAGPAGMALGLAAVVDWSTEQPFIDVMKTARPWIGHRPGQWGGITAAELAKEGVLDTDGWPVSVPHHLSGIGTLVLTDLPKGAVSLAGRYRIAFDGDGIVEVGGRAQNLRYGKGHVEFDYTPGPGSVTITIKRTDRQNTGDYVRNISVVMLDHLSRHKAQELFNPVWLSRVEGFGALRFMDWMDTNDSAQSDWNDRPELSDYTYTRKGVPLEVMVRLANILNADPWFNMPHAATDHYIRSFAETVLDSLDPQLKAYVEYSNEVWNWQFIQADWVERRAVARWGREYAWMQYYGMRTAQIAHIWKDVFGPSASDRLVAVISTQTGWKGLEADALEAPLWVAEDPAKNLPPATVADAYAIAGYFGRALGAPEYAAIVRGWIADSRGAARSQAVTAGLMGATLDATVQATQYDAAIVLAARELRNGLVAGLAEDTLADLSANTFPYHADIAARHGLDLIMYEGGSHVAGHGEVVDDDEMTAFFIALNYSTEMGMLYSELLNIWRDSGGKLFNVFVDVAAPSKWGSWGALRHLDDTTSRWEAILGLR